jgi:predicted transcriptional regulator
MAADTDPIRLTLTMSPSLNAKLEQLAMTTCSTKAEVLRKAIVLYELAQRASSKDHSAWECLMKMTDLSRKLLGSSRQR